MHYYSKTKTFQIPKKYEPDPELGTPSFCRMLRPTLTLMSLSLCRGLGNNASTFVQLK